MTEKLKTEGKSLDTCPPVSARLIGSEDTFFTGRRLIDTEHSPRRESIPYYPDAECALRARAITDDWPTKPDRPYASEDCNLCQRRVNSKDHDL
jgi:hypothetical protein